MTVIFPEDSQESAPTQTYYESIESYEKDNVKVDIDSFKNLCGPPDDYNAMQVYTSKKKLGQTAQRVRLQLSNSIVQLTPGALQFMVGDIDVKTKDAPRLFSSVKKTRTVKYSGTGQIFLEPSWSHYAIVAVKDHVIVDRGCFLCASGGLKSDVAFQKSIKSILFSGKSLIQDSFKGQGWIVIKVPVALHEIHKVRLNNDVLKVDGSFTILRTGQVSMDVENLNKGLGKLTNSSGEGLMTVFKGTGEVWLLPTVPLNEELKELNKPLIAPARQ